MIYTSIGVECSKLMKLHADTLGKGRVMSVKPMTRLVVLDFIRIGAAIVVFMGHGAKQYSINYHFLQPLVNLRENAMTLFFMLSGLVNYFAYHDKNMMNIEQITKFYKKRIIALIPLYLLIGTIYVISLGQAHLLDNIKLAPVELLGIQTMFESLFAYAHNGGTWFISCLLLGYFIYPVIQELIKKSSKKCRVLLMIGLSLLLLYFSFVVRWFSLSSLYSNPIFRSMEFCLGVIIGGVFDADSNRSSRKRNIQAWLSLSLTFVVCLYLLYSDVRIWGFYSYNFLRHPLLSVFMLSACMIRIKALERCKLLRYASTVTYEFFLIQLFVWKITAFVIDILKMPNRNISRMLVSFIIAVLLSCFLHEIYQKPLAKLFTKKWKLTK